MLETDDMEEDYFTPASSTTLANIFGKRNNEHETENESLKYTPPKPQSASPKPEESKATQCVMACALYGYEWVDNVFTPKGMLGFAILKIIKTGHHNIVLYDSNKKTLSCCSITSTLKVTVKGNVNFSYYDNVQKYWSIYCKQEEGKKFIEILQKLNAVVKYSSDTEKEPSEERVRESPKTITELSSQADKQESDTDSSINRRTKMSILNRMASMGHSVLPPHTLLTEKTSDSSDTNDANNYSKAIRHKVKGPIKRNNNSEKNVFDIQSLSEIHKISRTEQSIENTPTLYTHVGGQLVPVTNTNILTTPSGSTNEMNMFMSEQRVNNSEVRINISRMTDKVDTILSKLTDIASKDTSITPNDFQTEILKKLLSEYENKIKSYEEIIKSKSIDKQSNIALIDESDMMQLSKHKNVAYVDTVTLNCKISELQQTNKEKGIKIENLESELQKLQKKCSEFVDIKTDNDVLVNLNEKLKQELSSKNKELLAVTEKLKSSTEDKSNCDDVMKDKIKNIMNDTFHAIAANFENDNTYTGNAIRSIVATIIKRVTTESL